MQKHFTKKTAFLLLSGFAISISLSMFLFSCGTNASAEEFEKIKNTNSVAQLNKFIQQYPDIEYTAEAKKIRNKLVFDSISEINTVQAYKSFITDFPNAEEVKLAEENIKQLKDLNPVISTFRGNSQRNYYGNECPSRLDEIWTTNMGSGKSFAYGKMFVWTGAGWTGQPLVVTEDTNTYIIQGCFDYNVKKINAKTGKIIWRYKFDDIIKGTGSIWVNKNAKNKEDKLVIMQGSRRGEGVSSKAGVVPSFRAISFGTGKELWRMNSKKTPCYSRDVDGSAAIIGDTAYIALENGIFTVFDPDHNNSEIRDGIKQPKIHQEINLWTKEDIKAHGGNLVAEASATVFNGRVYVASGSGHVYGYNLKTKEVDWDFYTGSDMDGSAPVTNDSCILISLEKEYIRGHGGVFKLDPSKPAEKSARWYFPVGTRKFALWDGGIIGSVAVNDQYIGESDTHIAAFLAIDGYLYVVDHKNLTDEMVAGPDGVTKYPKPKLLYKKYVGGSISSPIIVGNRIVACTYEGIYLFEHDKDMNFKLLDEKKGVSCEASPICWDNKIYIVSNTTGLMYCLGEK